MDALVQQCEGCGRRFDVQYAADIDKWLCWRCLVDSDGFVDDGHSGDENDDDGN